MMRKKNQERLYSAPKCLTVRIENERLMQSVSFNNPGTPSGSGHSHAGDSGGLNAKANPFLDEEEDQDRD